MIGRFATSGAEVVFTACVDDYAEVWVDGQMPRRIGNPSPATIQGFNIPRSRCTCELSQGGGSLRNGGIRYQRTDLRRTTECCLFPSGVN